NVRCGDSVGVLAGGGGDVASDKPTGTEKSTAAPKAKKTAAQAPTKPAAKKSPTTESATKAPAKKTSAKKTAAKKTAAKKTAAKRTAKKAPAKKAAATSTRKARKQPSPLRGKQATVEAKRLSGW